MRSCKTSTCLSRVILISALILPGISTGHPSAAPDVKNAHVYAFEAGYSADDPDDHLESGGKLLISELNCIACHSAPEEVLAHLVPTKAPDLAGVGSRLSYRDLWLMVRNPHFLRKGSTMPGQFSHIDDRDPDAFGSISKYLSTLTEPEKPEYPEGDADRGRNLYHQVGCVACHNPATDFEPPNTRPGFPADKPGIPSVPIRLADLYKKDALISYLLDPLESHPAGRMPKTKLTVQEAADLAEYLQIEGIPPNEEKPEVTAEELAKGKRLFGQLNCAACHQIDDKEIPPPPLSRPLLELDISTEKGCLAPDPVAGAPHYKLSELQRKSISITLTKFKKEDVPAPRTDERIDQIFSSFNCYACHERGGKGGPEVPRAQYFATKNDVPEFHKEFAILPPSLTGAGHKLTSEWLEKILKHGEGHVRPYMHTRMPHFGSANMEELRDLLVAVDTPATPLVIETGKPDAESKERGAVLFSGAKSGLNCAKCHGVAGKQPTGEIKSIDLSQSAQRLNSSFFKELLLNPDEMLPGSSMPNSLKNQPGADEKIEQIWRFLEGSKAPASTPE